MTPQVPERPERMAAFFDERSDGYDEHMRRSVTSFDAFYEAIARPIPQTGEALQILDVGCGTGLELDLIFRRAPNAHITGIDLSAGMLAHLRSKYIGHLGQISLIQGSYLEIPFATAAYDFVLSVMTLHHLLAARKRRLYERISQALKVEGTYIEGDYVVSEEQEKRLLAGYEQKTELAGEDRPGALHVDIPMTMERQRQLLFEAGFDGVEVIWQEGEAAVYTAHRPPPSTSSKALGP